MSKVWSSGETLGGRSSKHAQTEVYESYLVFAPHNWVVQMKVQYTIVYILHDKQVFPILLTTDFCIYPGICVNSYIPM